MDHGNISLKIHAGLSIDDCLPFSLLAIRESSQGTAGGLRVANVSLRCYLLSLLP